MSDVEIESLLSPVAGDAPCGADLEYDPAFLALQEAAAGKPEQQYGSTVIPAEPPDWPRVHEHALALAARTRDLRVAVWMARSGARVGGLAAMLAGLQLARGLVERHWGHVHPRLDAADHDDPTARLNALRSLAHPAGLADLRAASLDGTRGGVRVRDVELAFGPAELLPSESVPSEDGVLQGVTAVVAAEPATAGRMRAAYDAVQGLSDALEQHVPAGQAPDFAPLKKVLQRLVAVADRVRGDAAMADGADAPAAPATNPSGGSIRSREDALRQLDRVCEWLERNEPSNPAPLLIRRAQRLMTKNFVDIIRDLVPDGLNQIEKLAGVAAQP